MQPEESVLTQNQPSQLQRQDKDQDIIQEHPQDHQNEIQTEVKAGTSRQDSELSLGSVYHAIQQLSPEDSAKEEERAAEKIKQNLRPISKLQTVRRNITQTRHSEDSGSEPATSNQKTEAQPQEGEPSHVNRISSIITDSISGSAVEGNVDTVKVTKTSKKNPKLIEIESPRLVDAQAAVDDRRYFQRPEDPPPEGDFVYDFLYQHQRGAFILGRPKFSSKSLLPIDPDEWTDQCFNTSPMNTSDYSLPDPSWEWVHKSWLVDMTGDVDEDGWEYALTFHGSPWHGSYEMFRSFARRRRWLRLRRRKGKGPGKPGPLPGRAYSTTVQSATWTKLDVSKSYLDDPSPFPTEEEAGGDGGSSHDPKQVDLYKIMKKARSDREKLSYAAQYVVRYPGQLEDLEKRLDRYLNLFDYEASRREFLSLLATYSGVSKGVVANTASHLAFYSDRKQLELAVDG
ncbi:hypothetical protein B0O80DRAFT_429887 [Mortierella sp. GBAus27b]|nr:hypothetical protein BGX31_004097 [Mortierella sp. GBA43]KAI8347896.1 hypothetical protein B0O80DRAFT_429887 [Mortierella sp. GBAus27b]